MGNKRKAARKKNASRSNNRRKIAKRLHDEGKLGRPAKNSSQTKALPQNLADWTRDDHVQHNKHRPRLPAQMARAGYTQTKTAAGKWMTRSPGKDGAKGRVFYQGGEKIRTESVPNHIRNPRAELKPQAPWRHESPKAPCKRSEPSPAKPQECSTPSQNVNKQFATPVTERSKHDYGYFVRPDDDDETFTGITSWRNCKDLFASLQASCDVEQGGKRCGGKYCVTKRVESGTGGELCFCTTCDRCGQSFVCGDGARNSANRQHPKGNS